MSIEQSNDALPLMVFAWQVFGKDETVLDSKTHDVVVKFHKRPKNCFKGLPKTEQGYYTYFKNVVVSPATDDKVIITRPAGAMSWYDENMSGKIPPFAIAYD